MNWLQEAFLEPTMVQAVIIISLVSALGLYLGRIKIFGISLGITFVFFAGILAGHLGIVVNKDMLYFAQSFGLILFVYALGLQVGPGFFSSLKKGGVAMNMMGLGVILLGLIMTVGLHWVTGVSLSNMVGLLCGAVTNTPALGAAQQALLQIDPANTKGVTDMALACAVAYPLGVVGVILAIIILRALFADKKQKDLKEQRDTTTYVAEFHVSNPAIYEKSIKDVMKLTDKHFVISRVWRNGKVSIPTSDTLLHEHDHLLIISVKSDVENIKVLFGEQQALMTIYQKIKDFALPTKKGGYKYRPIRPIESTSVDETLLDSLQQLRKQIAEREHTPAYILFSDDALEDMVRKKPVTLDEFSEIRGVGQLKLDKYGKVFVALIRFVLRLPKKE
jgi:AspT/YidE/YbjL antiporter-like protein